jgi:hypothetical protein
LVEFFAAAFGGGFALGFAGGFFLAFGVAELLAVVFAGAVEFGEGALVAAVPVGAVAVQEEERGEFEGGGFAVFEDAGVAEGGAVGDVAIVFDGGVGVFGEVVFEEGGFGIFEAVEGPAAVGDFFEGEVLARGGGFVDGGEFFVEAAVGGRVFVFEDGVALEGESVLAGVLGGAGLAFGGAGSGGVLGVGAVGGGAGIRRGVGGGLVLRNEAV